MILSIDIGTSYSSMSFLGPDGKAKMVDIGTGACMFGSSTSLPTAVFAEKNGQLLVGQAAMNRRKMDASRFRMEFKRNLGEKIPILLGDQSYLPEQLYTELFRHMREKASHLGTEPIQQAYLTCPANYSSLKKELLKDSAAAAGLFETTLVSEPVAAAMCYCAEGYVKDGQNLLTYDFGGGTFDTSLLRYENGEFQLLAEPSGIENCGGVDLDRAIFKDIIQHLDPATLQQAHQSPKVWSSFSAQLSELAVKAKHHLSSSDEFTDYIMLGFDQVEYHLTRARFEQMAAPLVGNTIKVCHAMLKGAGIRLSDLSGVLLVGGTSRIPLVRSMVEQFAGQVPVYCAPNPDLAVAQGALNYGSVTRRPLPVVNDSSVVPKAVPQETVPVEQKTDKPSVKGNQPPERTPEQMFLEAKKLLKASSSHPKLATGLEYLEASLSGGYLPAVVLKGEILEKGIGVPADPSKAFSCYAQAAKKQNADGMIHLAQCYEKGIGIHTNMKYAETWYRAAAKQGSKPAEKWLDDHFHKNPKEMAEKAKQILQEKSLSSEQAEAAEKMLLQASELGSVDALLALGEYSLTGRTVHIPNAEKYYTRAADAGSVEAMKALGRLYDGSGSGSCKFMKNLTLARKWYRKAADAGDSWAKKRLQEINSAAASAETPKITPPSEYQLRMQWKTWLKQLVPESFIAQNLNITTGNFSQSHVLKQRSSLNVGSGETVLLAYDATFLGSGKSGFILTEKGIYSKASYGNPIFTTWPEFVNMQIKDGGSYGEMVTQKDEEILYANGIAFTQIDAAMRHLQDLLKLKKKTSPEFF